MCPTICDTRPAAPRGPGPSLAPAGSSLAPAGSSLAPENWRGPPRSRGADIGSGAGPFSGPSPEAQTQMRAIGAGWLLTFTDLAALLLALFILILSMRTPPSFEGVLTARDRALRPAQASPRAPRLRLEPIRDTDYLGTILFNALKQTAAGQQVRMRPTSEGLLLRAPLDLWTATGGGPLDDVSAALDRVARGLQIRVHVPAGLRGAGLGGEARGEAFGIGLAFARRLRETGFTGAVAVLLGPPARGTGWTIDLVVDDHGTE